MSKLLQKYLVEETHPNWPEAEPKEYEVLDDIELLDRISRDCMALFYPGGKLTITRVG